MPVAEGASMAPMCSTSFSCRLEGQPDEIADQRFLEPNFAPMYLTLCIQERRQIFLAPGNRVGETAEPGWRPDVQVT
jgi:hypothetical protein